MYLEPEFAELKKNLFPKYREYFYHLLVYCVSKYSKLLFGVKKSSECWKDWKI